MKIIQNIFQVVCVSAVVAFVDCSLPSLAAVANVVVGPETNGVETFAFAPVIVTINAGDSVIWTWQSSNHSTTSTNSPSALWDSGVHSSPFSFTNKFNSVGSFGYLCTVHRFTGSVIVQGPTISITNPASGTVLAEPANVTIQAVAADIGGSVTNVQFLVSTTVLTNETAAPFAATTNNLAAGSYTLSAVATDNGGLTATNAVTISVVTPVLLALATPTQLSSSSFQFNYSANIGLTYVVQQSSDLAAASWISISTNVANSNPVTFVDTNAIANPGFYRVVRLPNP